VILRAASRAFEVVTRRFFLLMTPIAIAGLAFRALVWILHRLVPGKGLWLEFFLLFIVSVPLELFAEAMVSAMYLCAMRGEETGWRNGLKVAQYPGAAKTIARLSGTCFLWMVPTLIAAIIVSIPLKALFQLVRPGPHHGFSIARGDHWWVVVWIILYGALLSRYSFVMPMLALRRTAGGALFRLAVRQVKGFWGVLAVIAIGQDLAAHLLYKSEFGPQVLHGKRPAAVILSILVGAVLSVYATGFRTELVVATNRD
jgi:hypothetical protein